MKEIINQLINNKRNRYKEDYNEMLGDYRREQEITDGYNGRQILELLQNCDDEQAGEVLIELNEQNKTVSISNDGNPFSEKGYLSLFIANLSSKISKKKYIGNKGLGFRSIINWSDKIEIISNGISLKYSQENLTEEFANLFSGEEQMNILNELDLKEGIVPIPMLSLPKIELINTKTAHATSIIITYKEEFLADILQQINSLADVIFLFLHKIETVIFNGISGKKGIKCLREEVNINAEGILSQQNLIVNDKNWTVYSIEEELPDDLTDSTKKEKDLYQISIAIEEKMLQSSPYLFSFFPTNIKLNQPYVLHATFDLDSTRNQINDSKKNKFLLNRIVDFTISVAQQLSKGVVNYNSLKILFHQHKADTLSKFNYYDLIDKAIKEQPLFPCVDNTYRKQSEVIFVSNEMAEFLTEVGGNNILGCHLIVINDKQILSLIEEHKIINKISSIDNYTTIINSLASLNITNQQRARLIKIIAQNFNNQTGIPKEFNLLTDNKKKIINADEDIYTPPTNDNNLKIPSFSRIQFIDNNLYEEILNCYNKTDYEGRGKPRFVYDLLKEHCNIHSFEPITVVEKIIRTTNEALVTTDSLEHKLGMVQEMNSSLYHYYKILNDNSKPTIDNIPTISKNNQIKKVGELHLSEYYPIGKNVELIFKDIYNESDYVASPELLGIADEKQIESIENFLLWLGINSFFKFYINPEKEFWGYGNSLNHHPFLSYTKEFRKDYDNYTGYDIKYFNIKNGEILFKQLDIHKIIVLAFIDDIFRRQLNNQDKFDSISFFYRYNYQIHNTPSYIKFLIVKNYKTDGFLLDEKYNWINEFEIDYANSLFSYFKLTRIKVKEILLNLGAVETLNELSIEKLAKSFDKLNQLFPDGSGSQSFYKKALAHFETNKLKLTKSVKLFARVNNQLKLYNQNQIYFSDNNFLPSSLSVEYPIFNFPLRAGAKKAIDFFEINDLNTLEVTILKSEINYDIQNEFTLFFNELKPYFLVYRLENIEKQEVKEDQVIRLNNLKFNLCNEVICKINDKEFSINTYHFIYDSNNKTYYIKVNFDDNVESLQMQPLFIDNFSEILLNTFSTSSEKFHFESLLRDNRTTIDYNIKKIIGDNALEEAKTLLGVINSKKAFWNIIFQLTNNVMPSSDDEFERKVNEILEGDTLHILYDEINNEKNMYLLEILFKKLTIKVVDFNKISTSKISTYTYNIKKLQNHLSSIEADIKQLIWDYLNLKKDEHKNLISYFNTIDLVKNKYENYRDLLENCFLEDDVSINTSLLYEAFDFIDLRQTHQTITYQECYNRNRNDFSEEDIVIIENNPEIHSLLYFDNNEIVINYLNSRNTAQVNSIISTNNHIEKQTINIRYIKEIKYQKKYTES